MDYDCNLLKKPHKVRVWVNGFVQFHISDSDLDHQVTAIKNLMPDAGQSMVKGILQAKEIHVSHSQCKRQ